MNDMNLTLHVDLVCTDLADFVKHFDTSLEEGGAGLFDDSIPACIVLNDSRPLEVVKTEIAEIVARREAKFFRPMRQIEEALSTTAAIHTEMLKKLWAAQDKALAELDEAARERVLADPDWVFEVDEELDRELDEFWSGAEATFTIAEATSTAALAALEEEWTQRGEEPLTRTWALIGQSEEMLEERGGAWRVSSNPVEQTGHVWNVWWEVGGLDVRAILVDGNKPQRWRLAVTRYRWDRLKVQLWQKGSKQDQAERLREWLTTRWGEDGVIDRGTENAPPTLPEPGAGILTPREQQIACLLAQGMNDARIAQALTISPSTAKDHRESIAKKWGVLQHVKLMQMEALRRLQGGE
jgi:DNA-binding CsgD family transcriptional regulator